jgi:hypothetical protein
MKSNLYSFYVVATGPDGGRTRHETVIPADTYSEAMRTLSRNAAKTTGIPAMNWLLAEIRPQ